MRRCPNPGCPFRVRHGFAAEFQEQVERCRSCGGPLVAVEAQESRATTLDAGRLVRPGVTSVLLIGLIGFAATPVPGFEALRAAGVTADFATWALWPSLLGWIAASWMVELIIRKPQPTLTAWLATFACTLALLASMGWVVHDSLSVAGGLSPSFTSVLVVMLAGLPVLLGVTLANDRWGVGPGISLVLAGLLLNSLIANPALRAEPLRGAITAVALVAGAALWLAIPTRASASGRRGGAVDQGLGLSLTVPSSGLLPVLIVALVPLTRAVLDAGPGELPRIVLGLAEAPSVAESPTLELVGVVALTGALAWLFSRPQRLVARWRAAFPKAAHADLEREANALFRRTALRSGLLLAVLILLWREQLPAIPATILAAILVDLRDELALRRECKELVGIDAPRDPIAADALVRALRLEQRPALVAGTHHRALYHRLGRWIPARLLVASADRARAEQLAAELVSATQAR